MVSWQLIDTFNNARVCVCIARAAAVDHVGQECKTVILEEVFRRKRRLVLVIKESICSNYTTDLLISGGIHPASEHADSDNANVLMLSGPLLPKNVYFTEGYALRPVPRIGSSRHL